jgi:hypothetical protein
MRYIQPKVLSTTSAVETVRSSGNKPASAIDNESTLPQHTTMPAYEADE